MRSIPQYTFGYYSFDLAIPSVAVEVERSTHVPLNRPRIRKRSVRVLKAGWALAIVWIKPGALPESGAADYVTPLTNRLERESALIGQYWMIRGSGELVAAGGLDGDGLTGVRPLI